MGPRDPRNDLKDFTTRLRVIEDEARSCAGFEATAGAKLTELEQRVKYLKEEEKMTVTEALLIILLIIIIGFIIYILFQGLVGKGPDHTAHGEPGGRVP